MLFVLYKWSLHHPSEKNIINLRFWNNYYIDNLVFRLNTQISTIKQFLNDKGFPLKHIFKSIHFVQLLYLGYDTQTLSIRIEEINNENKKWRYITLISKSNLKYLALLLLELIGMPPQHITLVCASLVFAVVY